MQFKWQSSLFRIHNNLQKRWQRCVYVGLTWKVSESLK